MLPNFTVTQWLLAAFGAFCIGFAKSGFPGSGLITVIIMAHLFGARESTGALLPMLICGDVFSVVVFHQHARWPLIRRMLPPTLAGVVAGFLLMRHLSGELFRPVLGWVILAMVMLQALRRLRPVLFEHIPHSRGFALSMGFGAGFTTMLANGAGPVMSLYFLAIQTPKYALVGTSAWFFLIVNVLKVPFSVKLGLIHGITLSMNVLLIPAIALGVFSGQRLIRVIPQAQFELLLLAFAFIASARLIGFF